MSVKTQMLRTMYNADRLATLAETLDVKGKGNPAVGKAGDAFAAQLEANLGKIPALEAQLKKNPALAGKIEALVLKDPGAFEKAIPAIIKDPNVANAEIDKASGKAPAVAAAAPAKPAAPAPVAPAAVAATPKPEKPATAAAATPKAEEKDAPVSGSTESPVKTAASATDTADKPSPVSMAAAPLGTGPSAGSPPSNFTGRAKTTEEKIAELRSQPGFDDLMTTVGKNEHMRQALQNGMNQKDPNAPNSLVDSVYNQVAEEKAKSPPNDNFLKQTAQQFENMPPGMQSAFAKSMADSPNGTMTLFKTMGPLLQMGGGGFLGSLFKEGSMLGNLLQVALPFIAKMMDLKGSTNLLAMESKPGLTAKALDAAGANPDKVAMVDRENGATTDLTEAGRAPAPAPYNRDNKPQAPGAVPGMQPSPT